MEDELKETMDTFRKDFGDDCLWLLATRVISDIYYSKTLTDKKKLWNLNKIRRESDEFECTILRGMESE